MCHYYGLNILEKVDEIQFELHIHVGGYNGPIRIEIEHVRQLLVTIANTKFNRRMCSSFDDEMRGHDVDSVLTTQ